MPFNESLYGRSNDQRIWAAAPLSRSLQGARVQGSHPFSESLYSQLGSGTTVTFSARRKGSRFRCQGSLPFSESLYGRFNDSGSAFTAGSMIRVQFGVSGAELRVRVQDVRARVQGYFGMRSTRAWGARFSMTISCGNTYNLKTWFQSKLLHVCFDITNKYRSV